MYKGDYMEYGCIYNENVKDSYSENSVCGNTISGKTVLITGGYGGVGVAAAFRFLREGCKVYIAGRNKDKLSSAITYLRRKIQSAGVEGILLDICSFSSIQKVIKNIETKQIKIDILVHCIGWGTDADIEGKFLDIEKKYFDYVYDINYAGIVAFTESIYEKMRWEPGEKQIVMVGSVAAIFKKYQFTPYGIAKTALEEYVYQLSQKDAHISVMIVEPGGIATSLVGSGVGDEITCDGNILHRRLLPEEIAAFIAFSCSEGIGKRLNGNAVEMSACEAVSYNEKTAVCPLEMNLKQYGSRLESYAGNSLENETIQLETNLNGKSADILKAELFKEGCNIAVVSGKTTHVMCFMDCDGMETVKDIYQILQKDSIRCIDQGEKGIFSVCVMLSDIGGECKIAGKTLEKMLEGLGEKMAQHGIYVNGVVATARVPLLEVIHCGIYLNSKYGRILTGEVLRLA